MALPIHFFRHTFAVGFIVQSQLHPNFRIWNSHGQRGYVTTATPEAAFRRFGSASAIPYDVTMSYAL